MIWFSMLVALVRWGVIVLTTGIVALVVLRVLVQWLRLNPFGWVPYTLRRLTEPFLSPLRRNPLVWQARGDIAPLLLIVLLIIGAAFSLALLTDVHEVITGIVTSLEVTIGGAVGEGIRMLLGYILLGVLSLLMAAVILQVIFSWLGIHGTRLAKLTWRASDPIFRLLHRYVPTMGMFDVTPMIAYFLLLMTSWIVRRVFLE